MTIKTIDKLYTMIIKTISDIKIIDKKLKKIKVL